ncbi:hypothetical protein [Alicyclobacillus kakegawensis]|uniref:hypothetical protein n=1 Tax=Alicyclobacillus kakegawensis TaxID=392012 RepID=UPI00082F2215|nr:hypothetical protein [Alicyclobacillus kakegawensis]
MPAEWFDEWDEAGYEVVNEWQIPYIVSFTREGWCGRVRALSFVLTLEPVVRSELDGKLAEMLRQEFQEEPLSIPHLCYGVVMKKRWP